MTNLTPTLNLDLSKPQNFDIKYGKSWTRVIYNILTADKQDVWTCKVHSKSIEFFTVDGLLLGTCGYHNWKSDVDIHLEQSGASFTMERNKGMFNETKSFDFQGSHLTWARVGKWKKSGLWKLTDDSGTEYAIIGHDDWKVNSRFEIVTPGLDQALLLAILITGMSELEYQRRIAAGAAAANSNAAAASAAVAAS